MSELSAKEYEAKLSIGVAVSAFLALAGFAVLGVGVLTFRYDHFIGGFYILFGGMFMIPATFFLAKRLPKHLGFVGAAAVFFGLVFIIVFLITRSPNESLIAMIVKILISLIVCACGVYLFKIAINLQNHLVASEKKEDRLFKTPEY